MADHVSGQPLIKPDGQVGSFRTVCRTSHFNYHDPIVFPGQRDATHLHMYFGNTEADHASTPSSLTSSGDGTCQGGPLNRSAYWMPAMFDRNGDVRPAHFMLAYYKRAGAEDVVPWPNGMKIVIGNAGANGVQSDRTAGGGTGGIDYEFYCGATFFSLETKNSKLIPNCAPGEFLTLRLHFPQCSDGRLDSPDHRSHLAYPERFGRSCPASHPIRHPELTYNVQWNNGDMSTDGWYLSSDLHNGHKLPGGTTVHADWIAAWHPEVIDILDTGCWNANHDCKGGTISPTMRLTYPPKTPLTPENLYNRYQTPIIIPGSHFDEGAGHHGH